MSIYRIICATRELIQIPLHHHIIQVGIQVGTWPKLWTVLQVREAMERGDKFYTVSESTKTETLVESTTCPHCPGHFTLRTPGAMPDGDLDHLPLCAENEGLQPSITFSPRVKAPT